MVLYNFISAQSLLMAAIALVFASSCTHPTQTQQIVDSNAISHADIAPIIDGDIDSVWNAVPWQVMDQQWIGTAYTAEDFNGRFKLLWNANNLFVLAEIVDDTLIDIHPNPLERYWDDDCLEIFLDPNGSGGNHQYNYNAFAYHIALDGNVADMGTDSLPLLLNSHLVMKKKTNGHTTNWEVALKLYDDKFDPKVVNTPITLQKGARIGFAIAYCDNDTSLTRECFVTSAPVEGPDKDQGWRDANVFTKYILK